MKSVFAAAIVSVLVASPALAKSHHLDHRHGATSRYRPSQAGNDLYDAGSGNRRSNLNPRDPAYAGGDTAEALDE